MLDFSQFRVLSFDCYGTLIDWETGIVQAVSPVLEAHGVQIPKDRLLELYAESEARAEQGAYRPYRDVLASVMQDIGRQLGVGLSGAEVGRLAESLGNWPPFADSSGALKALKGCFKLAVISNVDDDLFALSARQLGVEFDWVITAQQVRSYKPSTNNFRVALERIGQPPERVLHVAQSLYHDHVPARELGLRTVWVNRRRGKPGFGATPPAGASYDLEVQDLGSLAAQACPGR